MVYITATESGVLRVDLDEENKIAYVVNQDQLSLAIGKKGKMCVWLPGSQDGRSISKTRKKTKYAGGSLQNARKNKICWQLGGRDQQFSRIRQVMKKCRFITA